MKQFVLIILIIVCSSPAMAEVQTLEQALALTYQHDSGLQAERAKLRTTDEQVSQALSNWRPSIDGNVDVGRTKQTIGGDNFYTGSNTLSPRDAGINITQPVFRGFRTVGSVDSAEASIRAGRAQLQNAEEKLFLDAGTAYLDVWQAQQLVNINRKNESDLKQEFKISQDRFKIGEIRKTDISQAESRMKVAMVARLQAENELLNKRLTLVRYTGDMPGTLAEPTLTMESSKNYDELVQLALDKNPSIIAATYNEEADRHDVEVAKGSLLPELNVVGNATRLEDQDVYIPQRQDDLSVEAKLTIPLYRSGADYSKSRAAIQTKTQRQLELDDARSQVREMVSTAWQTLLTSREVISVNKEALEATGKALYGVRQEAGAGTRTTLDVLNAQEELFNANITLVKSQHDEGVAILQLKKAIGMLTADAMHLPVELYDPTVNYNNVRNKWIGFGNKN